MFLASFGPNAHLWNSAVIFLIYCLSCCCSQTLVRCSFSTYTDCRVGLRALKDHIIATSVINTTGADLNVWSPYAQFLVSTSAPPNKTTRTVCYISFDACTNEEAEGCYCVVVSAGLFRIVLNVTATTDLSNQTLKFVWSNSDSSSVISSDVWKIPQIFKGSQEVTTIQVNYENVSMTTAPCKIAARGSLVYIQYCCFNTPEPCVAKIFYQGMEMVGSPCAGGNLVISADVIYSFSHSVCGVISPKVFTCSGSSVVTASKSEESDLSGYRNAAIFLASTIAIGLIIATVHRLDASLLFSSNSRRRMEAATMTRKY